MIVKINDKKPTSSMTHEEDKQKTLVLEESHFILL